MDYKKFHRTNAVIELTGNALAAVWAVLNLFRGDCVVIGPLLPNCIASLLKHTHNFMLPTERGYEQKSYFESLDTRFRDNRTLIIISAILFCVACGLI
ncbi:MAG: hypothetical protein K2N71_00350, partial [Oscillospiraceae bacterium]|nr:hypothetical protein [Oscillospiraceae bacterium]